MYWTIEKEIIEPCVIKSNQIAIRLFFRFWLNKNDYGYAKTLRPIVTIKESSKNNDIILESDLVVSNYKVETPLHSHFIEVPINASMDFIKNLGDQILSIVKKYHELKYFDTNEPIVITNTLCNYELFNDTNRKIAEDKVKEIKNKF